MKPPESLNTNEIIKRGFNKKLWTNIEQKVERNTSKIKRKFKVVKHIMSEPTLLDRNKNEVYNSLQTGPSTAVSTSTKT